MSEMIEKGKRVKVTHSRKGIFFGIYEADLKDGWFNVKLEKPLGEYLKDEVITVRKSLCKVEVLS